MNILPKKRWHVRTKENMARVRRDEAKAAEEEKARAERVSIADNEDRVRRMKMRRQDPSSSTRAAGSVAQGSALYEMGLISGAGELDYSQATARQKHVNLFAELELQERKNLTIGNKDYAAEKKKERDEWESKMGIMKRFAEDTKEFAKEKYWWEKIPLVREGQSSSKSAAPVCDTDLRHRHTAKPVERPTSSRLETTEAVAKKKRKKEKHSVRNPHRNHRDQRERDVVKKERTERTEVKLERLRAERLQRERLEHQRASSLLASASAAGIKKEKEEERGDRRHDYEFEVRQRLEQERSSGYNSQFNPDFARPRRGGDGGSRR